MGTNQELFELTQVNRIHEAAKELQAAIRDGHVNGIVTKVRVEMIADCIGERERPEIWVTTSKILKPSTESGFVKGKCSYCGQEFNLQGGMIPIHGRTGGLGIQTKCEGSGMLPYPDDSKMSPDEDKLNLAITYVAIPFTDMVDLDAVSALIPSHPGFKELDMSNCIVYERLDPRLLVLTFKMPGSVFSTAALSSIKKFASSLLGVEISFFYGKTRTEAYDACIQALTATTEPELKPEPAVGEIETYKAGTGVHCPICWMKLILFQDGKLPYHGGDSRCKPNKNRCRASGATIDADGYLISYDPEVFNSTTEPESEKQTQRTEEDESTPQQQNPHESIS